MLEPTKKDKGFHQSGKTQDNQYEEIHTDDAHVVNLGTAMEYGTQFPTFHLRTEKFAYRGEDRKPAKGRLKIFVIKIKQIIENFYTH